MQQSAQLDFNTNLDDARELGELMYALHRLKAPTTAVVQGAAFGGALGLISCCDMAIGAEDAQLCLSEVRIGLAPAVISPFVVKAIGERAARRYALTAERFSGVRARELGLLAEVYPASELNARSKHGSPTCCRTARKRCAPPRTCCAKWTPANSARRCAAIAKTPSPASASAPKAEGLRAFPENAAPPGKPMTRRSRAHEPPRFDHPAGRQPRRNRLPGDAHRQGHGPDHCRRAQRHRP